MKYVFLQHRTTREPIIELGLAPTTHAELAARHAADGFEPVSAGFFRFDNLGRIETFGRSESLKLAAHPDDSRVLYVMHKATLATATD